MRSIYTFALLFLLPYLGLSQEEVISKNPKILRGLSLKGSHYDPKIVRTEGGIVGGRPEIGQYQPPIPYPQLQQKEDGALMTVPVSPGPSPSPYTTLNGMGYTSVCPADPTMAIGSSYIVQMINAGSGAKFQVWSKTSPYNVVASSALLGTKTGMQGLGDCIALYDQYHDRFILTELPANDNGLIVAVSQTADPSGNYNSYFFPLPFAPDYPKYSVWDGVLYAKTNNFSGSSFTGSSVFAFDLAAMVSGASNPSVQEFDLNQGTYQNYSMCPVGMVGANTISTPGGLFAYLADNSWTGSSVDKVGLMRLDPQAGTLSQTEITVSAYNPSVRSISQPKGQSLDALADVIMNQPVCRASNSMSASLAIAFTVSVSSKQAGVRCELLNYNSGSWSLGSDGTYTGSDGQNRWLPSVNIDADGKIGLGFNISGSRIYPSIGNVVLTANGSKFNASTEYRVANGTTSSNCFGRYGDYNHMVIDPSDSHTFWFTAMYNPASSWSTKIGSFTASSPNPAIVQKGGIEDQIIPGLVNKNMNAYPNPVHNTLILELPGAFTTGSVEIIDMSGKMLGRQNVSARQTSLNTSGLNNGVYILKVRSAKGIDYLKFVKQ